MIPPNETQEQILLHDVDGISRLSGTDAHGNTWVTFEVDGFAEQVNGECEICGAELDSGWRCLDGGAEVCDRHVEFTARADA